MKKHCTVIRVLAHTQISKIKIGQKKAHLMEIQVSLCRASLTEVAALIVNASGVMAGCMLPSPAWRAQCGDSAWHQCTADTTGGGRSPKQRMQRLHGCGGPDFWPCAAGERRQHRGQGGLRLRPL